MNEVCLNFRNWHMRQHQYTAQTHTQERGANNLITDWFNCARVFIHQLSTQEGNQVCVLIQMDDSQLDRVIYSLSLSRHTIN